MLKKLKRKFVVINMCLVGAVLLTVFLVVGYHTWQRGMDEVNRALEMALTDARNDVPDLPEIGTPPDAAAAERQQPEPLEPEAGTVTGFQEPGKGFEAKAMNYTAVVILLEEEEGYEIMKPGRWNASINDASMNEKTLEKAAETVRFAEAEEGKLKEMGLFYMKRETPEGTKAAFADSAYFDATMREYVVSACTLFLMGMAALLAVSVLLAGMAVAPVKKAWEQQKRFVADASHELKTPLTVILANNEILLSGMAASEADRRKWVASTQEEASHMKTLVEDLLFLARADEDTEGRHLVKNRLNFSELVTDTALQFEPVVFEAGCAIDTHIEEDLYLDCDGTQMKQLVHILLDNAVKYAGTDGQGYIRVSLKRADGKLQLTVSNTGDAIPQEELAHLFDRFYRRDKARTQGSGHGLGLSIAKTIVENHGGKIRVQSGELRKLDRPGSRNISNASEGTMFTVLL